MIYHGRGFFQLFGGSVKKVYISLLTYNTNGEKLARCNSATYLPFPIRPIAQVDVLSAALRASSLDTPEEASDPEKKSDMQDEMGVNELPNCKINRDTSVPLISSAVEVMNSKVY